MTVRFTVEGEPVGKGRPRFARQGNYVRTYTPDKTVIYENLVKIMYKSAARGKRFEEGTPLSLAVNAYFGIPKSTSKKKRQEMIDGIIKPLKKPDMDNIVKIIADSLNGVAYHDDTQIVICCVQKRYSENPRVEIMIGDYDYER